MIIIKTPIIPKQLLDVYEGFGYVDNEFGESHYVELHWYQEPGVGKAKMKIKVQPDGRIYLDEDKSKIHRS